MIGRFQPFHKGHLKLLKEISKEYDEIIIGIGSAQCMYVTSPENIVYKISSIKMPDTLDNPFTLYERISMIKNSLESENIKNYHLINIPDINIIKENAFLPQYQYKKINSMKDINKASIGIIVPKSTEGFNRTIQLIPKDAITDWIDHGISIDKWHLSVNILSSGENAEWVKEKISQIPEEIIKEWADRVISLIPRDRMVNVVISNNPLTKRLFSEKGYKVRGTKLFNREEYSGTKIRKRILSDEEWESLVPPEVAEVIKNINGIERIKNLAESDR